MRLHTLSVAATIVALATLAGCRYPATEVLVAVDSDAPADRLLSVTVSVRSGASTNAGSNAATFSRGPAGSATFPASFAVVPPASGPRDGSVTLQLEATLAATAGAPEHRFRRTARFRFTTQRTTHVPLFLAVSCGNPTTGCTSVDAAHCTVSIRCEETGQTCGDNGSCISPDIVPIESDASIVVPTADATATVDSNSSDASDGITPSDAPTDAPPATDPAIGLCTGTGYTCIARQSGTVACMGYSDAVPVLAGGVPPNRPTVVSGVAEAVEVTCGRAHACARLRGGSVMCWGANDRGQLGDGTIGAARGAMTVPGITGAGTVVAGDDFTCVRRTTGTVSCWGANDHGQLGDGTTMSHAMPVDIPRLTDTTSIAAGSAHVCAVWTAGQVICWGRNDTSQVGDGSSVDQLTPIAVPGLTLVTDLAAGSGHTCARTGDTVSCWGENAFGQLCSGDNTAPFSTPNAARGLTGIAGIAAQRAQHTCALRTNGTVACCGRNINGGLGESAGDLNTLPVDIPGIIDATKLSVSPTHGCVLRANGSVLCWGDDGVGQLGDGFEGHRSGTPVRVAGTLVATHVASGYLHTCGVDARGNAQCWGFNGYGQLGDGSTTDRGAPVPVVGASSFPSVVAGTTHSCVHNVDIAECWGDNARGQFGDGSQTSQATPMPGPIFTTGGLAELAAGSSFTCARRGDGAVLCWGANDVGQLGTPGGDSARPVLVAGLTAIDLAAGEAFACAVDSNTGAQCWGRNTYGELGDGTRRNRDFPSPVMGVIGVDEVAAGILHACARLGGAVVCWGTNTNRQLGSSTSDGNPTNVPGVADATQISAGGYHTCVLRRSGSVACWGSNAFGALGRGTVGASSADATDVVGLTGVTEIDCGASHCCAVETDGSTWCWGSNSNGQLGNGSRPIQPRPVTMLDVP